MMLADLLFMVIIGYVLYRFLDGFIMPIVRASRQMREQFRNMQDPHGPQSPGPQSHGPQSASREPGGWNAPKRNSKPPAEDYIDFEEIKEK